MIRLAVRVRREQAELVLAELLELAPAGVEEVAVAGGAVEYAVYGAPGELPRLPDLNAAVGDALVEISTSEVADDWSERWRSFHRPVLIGAPRARAGAAAVPALRVRPPWEPGGAAGAAGEALREIVLDPGQAFGTGAHATTRLCLELLLEVAAEDSARGAVLDAGTGSGVLAIAAAMLGFEPVLGIDHERESVTAARENATVNGVAVEVRRHDLRAGPLPLPGPAASPQQPAVICANLLRALLVALAGTLAAPPAHLLASGLLSHEADEIAALFAARHGLHERERRHEGEWAALWLTAR